MNEELAHLLDQGNYAYVSYRRGEALEFFRQASQLAPDNSALHHRIADIHAQFGEYPQALESILRALQHSPHNPWLHLDCGDMYTELGQVDRAIAEYEIAARLAPDDFRPHFSLAFAHMQAGRFDLARKHLEQAEQFSPKEVSLWEAYGRLAFFRQEYELARQFYQAIVDRLLEPGHERDFEEWDEGSYPGYTSWAITCPGYEFTAYEAEEVPLGTHSSPLGEETSDHLARCLTILADVEMRLNQLQAAKEHLQLAITASFNYHPAHLALCRLLYRLRDWRGWWKAYREYQRLLASKA